jgi:carbon-monoxide dehydrogenase small subunit
VLAVEAEGGDVVTIEGLARDGVLHPLQQAFIDHGGLQCGFCTPGLVMVAYALLRDNPHPTEHQVRMAIAGNLCRCTGYDKVVRAVMAAG